jgi:hypothetical protein
MLVLAGCLAADDGSDEVPAEPCDRPCSCTELRWPVWHRDVVRLDLLVVVDDSASMSEELETLRRELPGQLRRLLEPPLEESDCCRYAGFRRCGPRPLDDVRLAVVTTDLGSGSRYWPTCADGLFGCEAGDDGRFVWDPADPDAPGGIAARPHPFAGPEATDRFERVVGELLSMRANGCGFEQPLAAVRRALIDHAEPGGLHAGFRRPDAPLGLLIVTDEDDCTVADPAFFDPAVPTGWPDGVRCHALDNLLGPVEWYADAVRAPAPVGRWDQLVVGLAAGVPLDAWACLDGDLERCLAHPLMEQRIDPTDPSLLLPACTGPGGRATPARRLVEFAAHVGREPNVVSICEENWVERLVRQAPWPWYSEHLPERCLLGGLDAWPDPGTCRLPCDAVELLSDDRPCPVDAACGCDVTGCREPVDGKPCEPLKRDDGVEPDAADGRPRRRCVWRQATTRPLASGYCSEPLDVGWYYAGPPEPSSAGDAWERCRQLRPLPDYNHSYDPPWLEPGSDLRMECFRVRCPPAPAEVGGTS